MAKAKANPVVIATLAVFAPGFQTIAGAVEQTATGFKVGVKPSRKKHLEVTHVPFHVVVAASTGEDGYIVFKSATASVTNHEVDVNSAEVQGDGSVIYTTADGETLFVAAGLETSLYHEEDQAQEEPAPKGKAKPKAKVVEEDEEEEDEEEEEEEEEDEEEEPAPKAKSKGKTKAKPKAKVVEEDEEDEDEEEEEEEEEPAPKKKSTKSKTAASKSKSKAKVVEEDEDEEDEEDLDF